MGDAMTAFSNATEWDYWASNWCSRCIKEDGCPLVTQVMVDNTVPAAWSPGSDDLRDRYHCADFACSCRRHQEGM